MSLWFNEKMNTEIEFSAQNYPPVNFCTKIGEGVVYMPGRFVVELPMYTDWRIFFFLQPRTASGPEAPRLPGPASRVCRAQRPHVCQAHRPCVCRAQRPRTCRAQRSASAEPSGPRLPGPAAPRLPGPAAPRLPSQVATPPPSGQPSPGPAALQLPGSLPDAPPRRSVLRFSKWSTIYRLHASWLTLFLVHRSSVGCVIRGMSFFIDWVLMIRFVVSRGDRFPTLLGAEDLVGADWM